MKNKGVKIVGFRGAEAVDIIFYMSRILVNLNYKVLVYEYSPADEIEHFLPYNTGLDLKKELLDYRSVHFTKKEMEERISAQYDAVFINLGYLNRSKYCNNCDSIIYVADTDKVHMDNLMRISNSACVDQRLLVRGIVSRGLDLTVYIEHIKERFCIKKVDKLRFNNKDMKTCQLMQYNDKFHFKSISQGMYNLVINYVERLFFEGEESKRLIKAVNKAMKGG